MHGGEECNQWLYWLMVVQWPGWPGVERLLRNGFRVGITGLNDTCVPQQIPFRYWINNLYYTASWLFEHKVSSEFSHYTTHNILIDIILDIWSEAWNCFKQCRIVKWYGHLDKQYCPHLSFFPTMLWGNPVYVPQSDWAQSNAVQILQAVEPLGETGESGQEFWRKRTAQPLKQ